MKPLLSILAFTIALCFNTYAQNTIVIGSKITTNESDHLLPSGNWCFGSTCFVITNGVIRSGASITPGTATVTITSRDSTYLTVPNVTIEGTYFSWDKYVVPSNAEITGAGAPHIACMPGAIYTQINGNQDKWACLSSNGVITWNKLQDSQFPAQIRIGTVKTGTPGSAASVTNSGIGSSAVLNFTIPQGLPSTIAVGTVTQGSTGSSASVTNSGTSTNAVLNFTIPTAPSATDTNAPHLITPNTFTANNSFSYINSIPQADQFPGEDICAKIRAAATYAISNGIGQVDATHFSGTQKCASDPLGGLATQGNWVNLVINLGNVHVQTRVVWNINNQGITLKGISPYATQIEYTGIIATQAFLIGTSTPSSTPLQGITLANLFIYGGVGNVTDGIVAQGVFRSEFRNIYTWGVTSCGIHTKWAVTDTFYRPHTSQFDANVIGIGNPSAHSIPLSGLCLDQFPSGLQTTDGTVIDAMAEGLLGPGWNLISAASMVFSGGTSENNHPPAGTPGGMMVNAPSLHNIFMACDWESNSNNDVNESGQDNHYIGVIAVDKPGIQLLDTSAYTTIDGGNQTIVTSKGGNFNRFSRGNNNIFPLAYAGNKGVTTNLACPAGKHINAINIQGGIVVTAPTCN